MAAGSISAHHPNEDILDILHPVSKRAVKTRLEWLTGKDKDKKHPNMPEASEGYSPIDEAKTLLYGEIEEKVPNNAKKQEKSAKYAPKIAEIGKKDENSPPTAPIETNGAKTPKSNGTESSHSFEKTFMHSNPNPVPNEKQNPIPQPPSRNQANPIILENEFTALPVQHDGKKFAIPTLAPAKQSALPIPFASSQSASIESKSQQLEMLSHSSLKSQSPNLAIQYLENLQEFVLTLAEGSRPAREKLATLLSDAADSIKSGKGISDELYGNISAQFQSLAQEVGQSLWKAETYIATSRFMPLLEKNANAFQAPSAAPVPLQKQPVEMRTKQIKRGKTIITVIVPSKSASEPSGDSDADDDDFDDLTSSPLLSQRYAGGRANRCIVSKSSTSVSNHHSISRGSHRHCPIDGFIGSGGIATHVMHFRSSLKVFYNGLNWIGGWYLVERQCKMGRCL